MSANVQVVVGSESDLPKLIKFGEVLRAVGVGFIVHVISAHRNPEELREYCQLVQGNGTKIFVAAAGWAAALAGAIAAETRFILPVIGIPLPGGPYPNDSLYAMASMPPGCPVLIVPSPENAAIAVAQILSIADREVAAGLANYLAHERAKKSPKHDINLLDYCGREG